MGFDIVRLCAFPWLIEGFEPEIWQVDGIGPALECLEILLHVLHGGDGIGGAESLFGPTGFSNVDGLAIGDGLDVREMVLDGTQGCINVDTFPIGVGIEHDDIDGSNELSRLHVVDVSMGDWNASSNARQESLDIIDLLRQQIGRDVSTVQILRANNDSQDVREPVCVVKLLQSCLIGVVASIRKGLNR